MRNYLLLGYNSGGYRDNIQISFNGTIEILFKPDPKYPDTPSTISYFHVTHADGSTTDEQKDFMDNLILKKRGYHESFLVCQIFEIDKNSLLKAIKDRDISAAINLVEAGVDVNSRDTDGKTPLHLLAKEGDFFGFGHFLDLKADINAKDDDGNTPLDIHIRYKNDKNFVNYLLKKGAAKRDISFIKKILNIFQTILILCMPILGSSSFHLDFSGLSGLSNIGKIVDGLPRYMVGGKKESKMYSLFEKRVQNQRFTLSEAKNYCDSLSIDGVSVWYLPTAKEMLTLSTDTPCIVDGNRSIYIKKEYLDILPKVKDIEDLTFWTSNLTIENGYELGEIVSFAYSFNELENSPIDLSSDKRDRHFVLCKESDDVINIVWEDGKFLSLFGNNFRLSSKLKFIGSFDLEDRDPKVIDYRNREAYFPLKSFLMVVYEDRTLYILDLDKRMEISKIKLQKGKKLYLKQVQNRVRR